MAHIAPMEFVQLDQLFGLAEVFAPLRRSKFVKSEMRGRRNVQRELGKSTALEIGFLGSQSHRLERLFAYNEALPGATGSVVSRQPYPEFGRIQEVGNVAEANYRSLSAKLTRRLDAGLTLLAGYTLSKSRDNGSGIRTLDGDTLAAIGSLPSGVICRAAAVATLVGRSVATGVPELPWSPSSSIQ